MKIHALFSGTATPQDVIAAAEAGKPDADELKDRLFYAHLYIGLYREAAGDAAGAKEHITLAADKYAEPGDYMSDVAKVHVATLGKPAGK